MIICIFITVLIAEIIVDGLIFNMWSLIPYGTLAWGMLFSLPIIFKLAIGGVDGD